MGELIEKDLSYKIVGVLFDVYRELGGGYQEKYYQRAVAEGLKQRSVTFVEQIVVPLSYGEVSIGRYFLDFLIENRVVLELKSTPRLYPRDIKQVLSYLNVKKIELGILANFNRTGLETRRILRSLRDQK